MSEKVLPLSDLKEGTMQRVEVDGNHVALIRIGDDVYAIGDVCSHDDYSLSEGELDEDDCTVECPKHGALFDIESGKALTLPAIKPVPVYDAEVRDGDIWLSRREGDS